MWIHEYILTAAQVLFTDIYLELICVHLSYNNFIAHAESQLISACILTIIIYDLAVIQWNPSNPDTVGTQSIRPNYRGVPFSVLSIFTYIHSLPAYMCR